MSYVYSNSLTVNVHASVDINDEKVIPRFFITLYSYVRHLINENLKGELTQDILYLICQSLVPEKVITRNSISLSKYKSYHWSNHSHVILSDDSLKDLSISWSINTRDCNFSHFHFEQRLKYIKNFDPMTGEHGSTVIFPSFVNTIPLYKMVLDVIKSKDPYNEHKNKYQRNGKTQIKVEKKTKKSPGKTISPMENVPEPSAPMSDLFKEDQVIDKMAKAFDNIKYPKF